MVGKRATGMVRHGKKGKAGSGRRRARAVAEVLEGRRLLTVVAHYFNTPDWSGAPAAVQYPYDINVGWGYGSPDPAVRNDGFSSVFTGRVYAPVSGVYTFISQTDDDGFLLVNGRLVSQDPGSHTLRPAPSRSSISLTAGNYYDFIFYQKDRVGLSGAVMSWVVPGSGSTAVTVPYYDLDPYSSFDYATPNAPSNLGASASSGLAVALTWTGDPRATRYEIERSTDGVNFAPLATTGFVSGSGNGTGILSSYTDGSVVPGQSYTYRVRAGNFGGESDVSAVATAVTPGLAAGTGVEEHFYNQPLWGGSPQFGAVAPNINMVLANGQSPALPIQSRDFSSVFTGKISISTPGVYALLSNTDDDGYLYVDGALVSLDPGTHAARNPANFTAVQLGAGTHDVVLRESQGLNLSAATMLYSGPDTGGTLTIVPTAVLSPVSDVPATPTGLSVAAYTSDSVTLTWQDNSVSETGYVIERSTDGVNFTAVGQADIVANPAPGAPAAATYVDAVDPGAQYTYRVRAVNFDGQSVSGTVTVGTPARTVTDIMQYANGFAPDGGLMLDGYKSFDSPHPAFNSPAQITADGRLRLTDDQLGESRAAFTPERVPIDVFTTSFVYQARFDALPPDSSTTLFADGITFTIQNYNPGQKGVGYSVSGGVGGQGLGYAGTPNSVGVKLDLFQSPGDPSASSTGVFTSGSTPAGGVDLLTMAGINLRSGDPMAVTVSYRNDYHQMITTITDTVTQATFSQYNYLDLPTLVGGNWAYVGFTGATGGGHATQDVLNWTYSGRLGPPIVTAPSFYETYGFTPSTLTATVDFDGPLAGQVVDFNLNGVEYGTAVTDASGTATLNNPALATLDAGFYYVTASTAGDNLYAPGVGSSYAYVWQQYAQVQYAGMTMVSATSAGLATFSLRAILTGSAFGTGDIRNADVFFYVSGTDGTWEYLSGGPVSLVNPSDKSVGVSTATFTTNLNGAQSVNCYVSAYVDGDYSGYTSAYLTASMPSVGQVAGGGSLAMNSSAGLYAADAGSTLSFDLTARNDSGNAKGNLTITFTRTDSSGKVTLHPSATASAERSGSSPVLR